MLADTNRPKSEDAQDIEVVHHHKNPMERESACSDVEVEDISSHHITALQQFDAHHNHTMHYKVDSFNQVKDPYSPMSHRCKIHHAECCSCSTPT